MSIDQKELQRLRDAKAKLDALEAWGVDNWEGYDDALEPYHEAKEREEKLETTLSNILEILCMGIEEPAGRGAGYGFTDAVVQDAREEMRRLL